MSSHNKIGTQTNIHIYVLKYSSYSGLVRPQSVAACMYRRGVIKDWL